MSSILSAISAAGQLFGGYGLVTLGPVQFQGMEVPESITIGGEQSLSVFKLPGGQRVIQAMGRDDTDMAWSGYLEGPTAESRMRLLDSLRQSGTPVQLAFGQSSFQVVVHNFSGEYRRSNWIPYRIGVTVLQDNAASFGPSAPSLLGSLNSDLNSALGFDVGATVSTAVTSAQNLVNVAGALGLNSGPWASAIQGLQTAQFAVSGAQALSDGTISGVADAAITAGNILGVPEISSAASALNTLAGAAASSASLTQAGSFVSRTIKNLETTSA